MNALWVALIMGTLCLAVAFVPRVRARAQLAVLGLFTSGVSGALIVAPVLSLWLLSKLELPMWIIQHWGDIEPAAKAKVIILFVGGIVLAVIAWKLFYLGVYRIAFPDIIRVDAHGHATHYGRVYWREKIENGDLRLYFRYESRWTPPWDMEVLTTRAEPYLLGLGFKLAVPAARFENPRPRVWNAISLEDSRADIPTTPVRVDDFREWRELDLEHKEDIAKKGAQGHLFTQRERALRSSMDETFLYTGSPRKRRNDMAPIAPPMDAPSVPPVVEDDDEVESVPVTVAAGPRLNGKGAHDE